MSAVVENVFLLTLGDLASSANAQTVTSASAVSILLTVPNLVPKKLLGTKPNATSVLKSPTIKAPPVVYLLLSLLTLKSDCKKKLDWSVEPLVNDTLNPSNFGTKSNSK